MAKQLIIPSCSILSRPVEVSFASDCSGIDQHFSGKAKIAFQNLFEHVQKEPSGALEKLKAFAAEHPHAPMVLNLLAYCYIQVKDLKAAEKVVEEAYTRFPDYLFAKINYADLLLRQKKWSQVPRVFGDVLDLSQLFKRKKLHFSEVRGFMTTLGHYYHEIGIRPKALEAFRIAVQADPTHPSVLALEKTLFYNPLLRMLKHFTRKFFQKKPRERNN